MIRHLRLPVRFDGAEKFSFPPLLQSEHVPPSRWPTCSVLRQVGLAAEHSAAWLLPSASSQPLGVPLGVSPAPGPRQVMQVGGRGCEKLNVHSFGEITVLQSRADSLLSSTIFPEVAPLFTCCRNAAQSLADEVGA